MAECPRCRGISISRDNRVCRTVDGGRSLLYKTRCDACGFTAFNVLWDVEGDLQAYGWYTGQDIPAPVLQYTDIPREVLDG